METIFRCHIIESPLNMKKLDLPQSGGKRTNTGNFTFVFKEEQVLPIVGPQHLRNNYNNLLISSAQESTIRFSNARYILDRDKHDVYNTLYWQLPTRGFSVTIYNSTGNQIDIAQIAIYNSRGTWRKALSDFW